MSVAIATAWEPACMDADELDDYRASRLGACADCTVAFAHDMAAQGRCNGIPGELTAGIVREDEPMDLPTPPRRMALDVTAPPCASCSHEPVCALRAAFEGMASVEVGAMPVPSGLRLALVATVECDHFLRDRTKPAPVRVLTSQERGQANGAAKYRASTAYWTPERRAAQGERMRARNAAKVEREAATA